jgi:hypothetical protein
MVVTKQVSSQLEWLSTLSTSFNAMDEDEKYLRKVSRRLASRLVCRCSLYGLEKRDGIVCCAAGSKVVLQKGTPPRRGDLGSLSDLESTGPWVLDASVDNVKQRQAQGPCCCADAVAQSFLDLKYCVKGTS